MIVIKLWLDGCRPAPEGYVWCKSVNEAIALIQASDKSIKRHMQCADKAFRDRDYQLRNINYNIANMVDIEFIDFDYNLNDRAEFVNWLKETNHNYQLRAHINDPFGKE